MSSAFDVGTLAYLCLRSIRLATPLLPIEGGRDGLHSLMTSDVDCQPTLLVP